MCNLYSPCNPCAFEFSEQDLALAQTNNLLLASSFYPTTVNDISAAMTDSWTHVVPSLSWSSSTTGQYNADLSYPTYVNIPTLCYPSTLTDVNKYHDYALQCGSLESYKEHATFSESSPTISSCSSPASSEELYTPSIMLAAEKQQKLNKKPALPKLFGCPLCTRSFARKHDLQRHVRVHTGDKPYACLNCKKAFARTDALKRHLRMEDACRTSPIVQAMKVTGSRRYRNL